MSIERIASAIVMMAIGWFAGGAQSLSWVVTGQVTAADTGTPVEFATVDIGGEAVGMTDQQGHFALRLASAGRKVVRVTSVGYEAATDTIMVRRDMPALHLRMAATNLLLEQVVVTAQRKTENATTSYVVDRQALENQQIINLADITTLLPGGKTANATLMTDSRIALRAAAGEKGNASFGTAIEVDGQRLQNNASAGETTGASLRTLSSTNVASVEVVPGIASVEYGDLSNGIVKVSTKRGHTPWEVTLATNPHTKQVGVNKGFNLRHGVLNASFEHTRSYSSLASPHTAYQRNTVSLNYRKGSHLAGRPLVLNLALGGNVGGYNSKADPDLFVDTYSRQRDHVVRGAVDAEWTPGAAWLSAIKVWANFSLADKQSTRQTNDNSSSAQAQIHATDRGYYIATDYDENPNAPIILGPTGYWYVKSYRDDKPRSLQLKARARWSQQNDRLANRPMAGLEWTASGNGGRGRTYDDMRYAPTWREYRYDKLPWMHNIAAYAEDRLNIGTGSQGGELQLVAGVRADATSINGSDYGTTWSVSPRANVKWQLWSNRTLRLVQSLSVYAGAGKSVKLPSFDVLYPTPSYADRLAFVPASTADNRAFYAYSVTPFTARYNPSLKWQQARQIEAGIEAKTPIGTLSVAAFHTRTVNPYLSTNIYSPFSYNFTSQAALEGNFPIAVADRIYAVDRNTGIVTVTDRTGAVAPQILPYTTRNTFNTIPTHVNGSAVTRAGVDWIADFNPIAALHTTLRVDGSYYHYRGVEHTLIASQPSGAQYMSDGVTPYQYVGYYRGTAQGGGAAYATVPNGSVTGQVNNNLSVITHIPAIRLIISLRIETTLLDRRHSLSRGSRGEPRGYVLADPADYFGTPYTGSERDCYVALWPVYYSTWEQPDVLVPFADRFTWAHDNDQALFNELAQLVVKTNHPYNLNPDRVSAYVSGNINITKEIGDHVSVSFLANNFWNSMARVKSTQTGLRTTIYNAGYIPPFYYGLTVRVKL